MTKIIIEGTMGSWNNPEFPADTKIIDVIRATRDHLQYRKKDDQYDLYAVLNPATPLSKDATLAGAAITDGARLIIVRTADDDEPSTGGTASAGGTILGP